MSENCKKALLYRCPIHGLIEDGIETSRVDFDSDPPRALESWLECPVAMGYEDVCHSQLDGPFKATIQEDK